MKNDSSDRSIGDLLSGLSGPDRQELKRTWDLASIADDSAVDGGDLTSAYESVRRRTGGRVGRARTVFFRMAGLAAALVAGMLVGQTVLGPAESPSPTHESLAGGRYLILIRNDADPSEARTPEDTVEEFRRWARDLAEEGRLVDAAELQHGGVVLLPGDADVRAEELSMIEERATGYFMIRASNRMEAEIIARGCPHLRHGGTIEVREIITS